MAQTAMTVRLDNQLKVSFDRLCEQFGMSANTAINIFVKAVIRSRSIPFAITAEQVKDVRQEAMNAFSRMRSTTLSMPKEPTLDEINEEIRIARHS